MSSKGDSHKETHEKIDPSDQNSAAYQRAVERAEENARKDEEEYFKQVYGWDDYGKYRGS